MNYPWSSSVDTLIVFPTKKNYGQLLLSFIFCTLMLGCDGQSTATANSDSQISTNADSAMTQEADIETSTATAREDEGTSLIDAAKDDRATTKRSSPMIAERRNDSALQATLIGDYNGMLSCKHCDGVTWTLNLHSDGTVKKTTTYTRPHALDAPLIESGVYRQDDKLITIVYDKKNIETYGIYDNHLVKLDANKKPDADYTLSRK